MAEVKKIKCQNDKCCFQWDGNAEYQVNKCCPVCKNMNIKVEDKQEKEE